MARINRELVILVGRDRENPRTHREAFEITGGLGEVLDKHIKRNNLNKSEFIREAVAAKLEAEMSKEPLIKDEKIRKAVRAWAGADDLDNFRIQNQHFNACKIIGYTAGINKASFIGFQTTIPHADSKKLYTIDELCGAPEPLEPSFIDLDERIKEKEEEC